MAQLAFYGKLRDIMGCDMELELPANVKTLNALQDHLTQAYTGFGDVFSHTRTKVVLNDVLVHSDMPITDADRIEFLPPFSGG